MDTIETMRDELESLQTELQRIKNENIELSQQTRLTRLYRDEIDTLNERISKMDKYQQELERYKERAHDVDTLKTSLDDLQNESKSSICINDGVTLGFRSTTLSSSYASRTASGR